MRKKLNDLAAQTLMEAMISISKRCAGYDDFILQEIKIIADAAIKKAKQK